MTPIDVLTPTEKEELAVFVHGWKAGEKAVQTPTPVNPSLASQEPCIGHWPANLHFPNEQDTQTALDLPKAAQGGFKAAMRELWHTPEFTLLLAALAVGLVIIWVAGK